MELGCACSALQSLTLITYVCLRTQVEDFDLPVSTTVAYGKVFKDPIRYRKQRAKTPRQPAQRLPRAWGGGLLALEATASTFELPEHLAEDAKKVRVCFSTVVGCMVLAARRRLVLMRHCQIDFVARPLLAMISSRVPDICESGSVAVTRATTLIVIVLVWRKLAIKRRSSIRLRGRSGRGAGGRHRR